MCAASSLQNQRTPLSDIVKEVPNVDLRLYRIGIELLDDSVFSSG
jgi:hypothetical protein